MENLLCKLSLLVHPKALPFGTGLRTKKLKTCHRQLFLSLFALSEFDSLSITKKQIPKRYLFFYGGDEENRTPDPLLARQVLSQLSYTPIT